MNTKVRTFNFKRSQFIEFLSNAKDSLIHKEGSIRIDEIEVIKMTGNFIPGKLINTPEYKSNNNTIAEKNCSYIIKKTARIFTENGPDQYEQILIYEGNSNNKSICENNNIEIKSNLEIYTDINIFNKAKADKSISYNLDGNNYLFEKKLISSNDNLIYQLEILSINGLEYNSSYKYLLYLESDN